MTRSTVFVRLILVCTAMAILAGAKPSHAQVFPNFPTPIYEPSYTIDKGTSAGSPSYLVILPGKKETR